MTTRDTPPAADEAPALSEILADSYPDREKAERVGAEAGLALSHIDLNGPAAEIWASVVELARTQGSLRAVLEIAERENPAEAERLNRAAAALLPGETQAAFYEGPGASPALEVAHFARLDDLDALSRLLGDPAGPTCVVVTGPAGVGKTTLVQQFVATRAPELFPDGAFWIDASSMATELKRTAARLGCPPGERGEAASWLARTLHTRRALLVLDDVVDAHGPGAPHLRIPGGKCRTVMTTSLATLHTRLNVTARDLRVAPWSAATSLRYLRDVVPSLAATPDGELDGLLKLAGGLSLVVNVVAQLLLRPGATAHGVRSHIERVLLDQTGVTATFQAAWATFQAAWEGLDAPERRTLSALAWCARTTRAQVVAAVAHTDEDEASYLLGELAERSLATFTGAERPWGMHEIVRQFVRTLDGSREARQAHLRFAEARANASWEDPHPGVDVVDSIEILAAAQRLFRDGQISDAMVLVGPLLRRVELPAEDDEILDQGTRTLLSGSVSNFVTQVLRRALERGLTALSPQPSVVPPPTMPRPSLPTQPSMPLPPEEPPPSSEPPSSPLADAALSAAYGKG